MADSRCVLVVLWMSMECVCLRQVPGTTVLLLNTLAWAWTGAIEHAPKIDGRHRAALTLKENVTHKFNCQSEGWNPHAPPLLTWYLNGERQRPPSDKRTPRRLVVTSREESGLLTPDSKHNSTFSLRARKWDRELVCAASSPHSGESYNATVTLNVQFQPEILRVNAHYTETSDPGLSLVLFALVRSNPPAHITWMDQSGQLVANTSDFLILDSRSYPWLTNHTLQVAPSSLSGNVSVNASNSVGAAQSNLALAGLTEFLQSRVEVPVLGILTGGAVGFVTFLILSLLVLCLLHKNKGKAIIDEPVEIIMAKKCMESSSVKVDKISLPRENMSLPSNMQLNDLSTLHKALETAKHHLGDKMREEEEDLSAAYAARGFALYPMVGYIYKVNSKSSDEIWL
ncbi:transmembrane protein 25-like isoform X1 [Oncorhynchus clarkii lewisi]|uniref:transmembrane protein 25-like isoform X1 n=2 Tax=Oncorhynchus clarkii lewisi TaxID=490388 RepID=UPI0039B839E6